MEILQREFVIITSASCPSHIYLHLDISFQYILFSQLLQEEKKEY